MFDFEAAILSWRRTYLGREGARVEQADELEDHLRQQFGQLRSPMRGDAALLSEEEAFLLAARRLGSTKELAEEFGKSDPAAVWRQRWIWMLCGYLGLGVTVKLISAAASLTLAITSRSSLSLDGRIGLYFLVILVGAAGSVALARLVARSGAHLLSIVTREMHSMPRIVGTMLLAIGATAAVDWVPVFLLARHPDTSMFGLMSASEPRWMVLAWARGGLFLLPFLALALLLRRGTVSGDFVRSCGRGKAF